MCHFVRNQMVNAKELLKQALLVNEICFGVPLVVWVFDPKLWPDGVVVRPWTFKSQQAEHSDGSMP